MRSEVSPVVSWSQLINSQCQMTRISRPAPPSTTSPSSSSSSSSVEHGLFPRPWHPGCILLQPRGVGELASRFKPSKVSFNSGDPHNYYYITSPKDAMPPLICILPPILHHSERGCEAVLFFFFLPLTIRYLLFTESQQVRQQTRKFSRPIRPGKSTAFRFQFVILTIL